MHTCQDCGTDTDVVRNVPLASIKSESSSAVSHLLSGRWRQGMEAAGRCQGLVEAHLSQPLLEVTEVQIAIWKCMWLKIGNMKTVKMN